MSGGMMDSKKIVPRHRLNETVDAPQFEFVESANGLVNAEGPWKIKAIGNTADVVNANGRRYPAPILKAAVEELRKHLHESAGQGRLLQPTGESDHPSDKGNRRALLGEAIINWTGVDFNGQHILLEGNLLGTSKGKDFRAQVKGGLRPGVSQRGYGESVILAEGTDEIEEVTKLVITGFDPTLPGEQSDADSGITFVESTQTKPPQESDSMTPQELAEMIRKQPELFEGLLAGKTLDEKIANSAKLNAEQLKAFEEKLRGSLGIDLNADLPKVLTEAVAAQKELTELKRVNSVNEAIAEWTKDLPYSKEIKASFIESIREANPQDAAAVKSLVESKRKEYDRLASTVKLAAMGYRAIDGADRLSVIGPVIEKEMNEIGIPPYARGSFEITEALVRRGNAKRRDWRDVSKMSINELYAKSYLERFDAMYRRTIDERTGLPAGLEVEAQRFEEAETVANLSLPYSVIRAVIAEAVPTLVASSIFDMGVIDTAPTRLMFEKFAGESGYTVTKTGDAISMSDADDDGWVALSFKRLTPGTVTVTSNPVGTTFDEGTDFVIDYANGKLARVGTNIAVDAALLANYTYTAIRKGEDQTIERGKMTLSYKILDVAADRLATVLTSEAIVFSRSQLGYDAVNRTLTSLVFQIRRKIDQGLMLKALSAALLVPDNSGGSWNSSGTDYDSAVRAIGAARVKVHKNFYEPTFILMSTSNSDLVANWLGFTQAGSRPDANLNANGFVGTLKGLPVFASTEFTDAYILTGNKEIVMHRVLQPLRLDGPHDVHHTDGLLKPEVEWYAEEYNGSDSPVPVKAAYVVVS